MRRAHLFLVMFAIASLVGCARCSLPGAARAASGPITIVSYNTHNLFDDVESGDEYPEFRMDSGNWSAVRYRARLDGLRDAVASLVPDFPDILCLQELESAKVLADLAAGPLAGAGYRQYAAGAPGGGLIRCGVLSRLPISYVRAHAVKDDPVYGPFRDMLEIGVAPGGATGSGSMPGADFVLFVCHWKSRREGAEETEGARRAQAGLLAARVAGLLAADPRARVVACGDFNESPDEWERVGRRYRTGFMPVTAPVPAAPGLLSGLPVARSPAEARSGAVPGERAGPVMYSPWAARGGFSYRFQGEGEQLDGFLLSPALCDGLDMDFRDFGVADAPFLFDADGSPKGWEDGRGYSDHLPVLLALDSGS